MSAFDLKEKVKWYDLKPFGNPLTCENNVKRNLEAAQVRWRFTTEDARIKLSHLYPTH